MGVGRLSLYAVVAGGCLAAFADPFGAPPDVRHAWAVHDANRPGVRKIACEPGKAPSDAQVLFDGSSASLSANWRDKNGLPTGWTIDDEGCLVSRKGAGYVYTREGYSDFQLHIEWASPMAGEGNGQALGNSGVFLLGEYEVQILDSFETDPFAPGGNRNPTYADGIAGAIYGQNPPLANPCRGRGKFNSYDIIFHAPSIGADGEVSRPATATVLFNGIVAQDHWLFDGPTIWRARTSYEKGEFAVAPQPIALQDHGNPVRFRNIWVRELPSPESQVLCGDRTACPVSVLASRTRTAARLEAEFDERWANDPSPLRRLVEALRIVSYEDTPARRVRVERLGAEFLESARGLTKPCEIESGDMSYRSIGVYFDSLVRAGVIAEDHPVIRRLRAFGPYRPVGVGSGRSHVVAFSADLNRRIRSLSAIGGGRIVIPSGRHVSGTIELKSNVELHLEDGAEIVGSDNPADYPLFMSAGTPSQKDVRGWTALVYAENATNIALTGHGTIDGRGSLQQARTEPRDDYDLNGRARNILFASCRGVTVKDVFLKNPGMWNQHYFDCEDVLVEGVRVFARCNHNNDGLDIDSCRRVMVRNCTIDSADDAIVLKSTSPKPCEDITVESCQLSSQATAFKCGTESLGGFRRIHVRDLKIAPSSVMTDYCHPLHYTNGFSAVEISTVDGGVVEDVDVRGVEVSGVRNPFYIRVGNRARPLRPGEKGLPPGCLRNVRIADFKGKGIGNFCASVTAFEPDRMEGVILEDISYEIAGGVASDAWTDVFNDDPAGYPSAHRTKDVPAYGLFTRNAGNIRVSNFKVEVLAPDTRRCRVDQ